MEKALTSQRKRLSSNSIIFSPFGCFETLFHHCFEKIEVVGGVFKLPLSVRGRHRNCENAKRKISRFAKSLDTQRQRHLLEE